MPRHDASQEDVKTTSSETEKITKRPARKPSPKSPSTDKAAADELPASAVPPELGPETGPESGHDYFAQIEQMSLNIAKAAMIAQNAVTQAAFSNADQSQPINSDPLNMAPTMGHVMSSLAAKPEKLFQAQVDLMSRYMDIWSTASKRSLGGQPPQEDSKDKRFRDPAWSENPVFDVMRQSYLATSEWMNNLISSVEDIDPTTRRRAEFFTKLLTDAISPANFLASNPVALKALAESNGESLVRGMQNFANDIERGGGKLKISQTDDSRFIPGENIATTPGKVVWRDELFELLQYEATGSTQYKIPLLIFPPWINKFYILDLRPENSMVRWLSEQGFSVFVCSWVNPDKDKSDYGFEDYLDKGIYRAIEKVLEQTGEKQLNAVGYCIGGTMLGMALSHAAARNDQRVASVTFFATQHDFEQAGDLALFTDETWLAEIEKKIDAAGGVLPSESMADTFNALRSNDLIWSFFVSNYLMGKDPPAFDLLAWNADQTRMPKRLHLEYLRRMYGQNALSKGEIILNGEQINLSHIKIPAYFQASREDHIAPMNSVFRSAKLFGGPVTYTLAGSGHIAGVINPPAANKYQHWINDMLPATLEEWQAEAVAHPGSWWPHWAAWLSDKSGEQIMARDPSSGPLKPLEPAPGSYVKVKS